MMFWIMFLVMATMMFLVTLMKMSPGCVADGGRTCRQRVFGLLPFNMNDANNTLHNVQFVKYVVTVSFMAQVLDTVTYLVPQVLDTAS